MTPEKVTKLILLISLAFAAVIVLSSFFIPNDDDIQAVTFVLITIWLVPFSYLIKLKKQATKKPSTIEKEDNE